MPLPDPDPRLTDKFLGELAFTLGDEAIAERAATQRHSIKPPCRDKNCKECTTWLRAQSFSADAYERLRDHIRKIID